jgi:tRNA-specific 2-thiouridylase
MRALALFSGGLDSMLAVKLIKDQGIEVTALFIDVGFGSSEDKTTVLKKRAQIAGADFEIINAREQFIQDILFSPKYGYGKNFNPCIDCHGNMVKIAKALLPKYNASFIITGEVVGQRPMSQRKEAIKQVTKLGLKEEEGLVLRPLCAKHLEPTIAELKGWVNREKLLDIKGRGRETQLALAKKFGFEDFESPGGGCLLTESHFAAKIKDFIKYDKFEACDIELLKVGRHLRLPGGAKLVIGRNKEENERLKNIDNYKFVFIKILDATGPLSMLSKNANKEDFELAARLVLTYGKTNKDKEYEVLIENQKLKAYPFESKEVAKKYFIKT